MSDLLRTLFYEDHLKAGAKMVDFGGWELPIQYKGIGVEHAGCRSNLGLFDVSHMGEIWIEGANALAVVKRYVTSSVDIVDGQAQYSVLCNHEGGIVDDIIIYRFSAEKFLLCVNAANRAKDFAWLQENLQDDTVTLTNASDAYAQVAVQGRFAEQTIQKLTTVNLSAVGYYHFATGTVGGVDNCIIARTGYTGEDGFEIFIPVADAKAQSLWQQILDAGAEFSIQPIGLGARDTLRLEACMNLYGNEMTDTTSPLESGVGWTIDWNKGDFIGKEAILRKKNGDWNYRLLRLVVDQRIPRTHCPVMVGDTVVGEVTSGTKSPSTGNAIALARVHKDYMKPETELLVDVRGKMAKAVVVKNPFFKKEY